MDHFSEPVHEEITQRIFGCEGDREDCADANIGFAGQPVVAGVRWNDDPPFQLLQGQGRNTACKVTETIRFSTQPRCWYQLFRNAQERARQGEALDAASKAPLLARSHYGDVQFFHAMASTDGEAASETQRRIMMWAEFTWRVARGECRSDMKLRDVPVSGFDQFFGSSGWRVQDLFTLGNAALRPNIEEVAFGSLLHMVEDSFAQGHVDRAESGAGEACPGAPDHPAPGRIREFHSYIHQDPGKHAKYDSRRILSEVLLRGGPSVIDVGKGLVSYNKNNSNWEQVKPYLNCVFSIADPEAKAGPGAGFEAN